MANLLSTAITGTATTSGSVVIGGTFANNPYNSVSSTRLMFGGGNEPNNYSIGTNLENYGGNYTKLDLRWHTGIRIGAQPGYGGVRFFSNETLASRIMSIGETDANVRIDNNLYIGGAGGWITDLLNAKYSTSGGTISGYVRINKNWAEGDFGAEQFTIYGTYPSITLRNTATNSKWLIHNSDTLNFYYGATASDNSWAKRFEIATNGNIWMEWGGWLSDLLNAKQNASTAITTSNIGSQSVSYASSAGSVAWGNVSSKPSYIMYYQGFTLDANTMDTNSTGFTYANNAPFYGPIARFSTGGGYDLWLGGSYNGGGNAFFLRTRDGDSATLNPWREIITSGNIGVQSVNYATSAGNADTVDSYHASSLWRSDGGNWNPGANITLYQSGNSQEWSFDIFRQGYTGGYWHVWDSSHGTMLGVDATNNYVWATGSMRAPIFYDYNNTGYYGDFASTSVMNAIRFGTSTNNATLYGNDDWGVRLNTDSGWIQFGPANSSWAHIYSNLPFYFNQDLYVNGTRVVLNSGTWGINITGNSNTTSQVVFSDLKGNFPSGAGGGYSFGSNHYSMGLDAGDGGWNHPHYRDLIIGYHTGIRIGANYSGIRFYNNSPTTDANNDGNGDGGEALLMTIGGYVGTANHTDVVVNNNLFANVSMRAPIFYDSNDTAFYVDPNSSSRLRNLYVGDSGSNWSDPGGWGTQFHVSNGPHSIIRVYARNEGIETGMFSHIGGQSKVGSFTNHDFSIVRNFNDRMIFYSGYTYANGYLQAADSLRAPIFYDSNDTGYYLDPNSESNLWRFTAASMTRNAMNYLSINSPYVTRSQQAVGHLNGIMGWGSTDLNTVFSNWGSGFFDSWGWPGQRPNDSASHWVGLQSMHYNHQNGTNGYGWQMVNGGNTNRWYLRQGWPDVGSWQEIITSGNIGSQSVNYATSAGSSSSSSRSSALDIVGYGNGNMTYYQSSGTFAGQSGWAGYFISNHGDGATYYNQTIIMPFWGAPQYSRLQGGTLVGPYTFWTTENLNDYAPNMNQYVRTSDNVTFNTTTAPTILVNNHSDNTKGYRIHNTSGSSVSAMFTNSSNQLVIAAGAVDQINLNKKVYVNGVALGVNVSPSATAGRIDASNDIVAYSSSDERLKYNITPIENAIDKVKSLTGVEFDWKPEYKHAHGYEGHDTGIIAQQVQEVIPSAVRTNDTGFLAVRYEKLIGLLVEGMKEQQAQIEELKAKLDGLTK